MTAAPSSRRRARRLVQLVATALVALLLSGCAGFSARITIVPSHAAFDVDLIIGVRNDQNGPQLSQLCQSFGKGGMDARFSTQRDMALCELKAPVPLKSKQSFVKHEHGRWTFQMTDKTLSAWLNDNLSGFSTEYPDGIKLDEFDDFHLQVDFPERVVEHGPGAVVDGKSVTWHDAKQLFSAEGLHAASVDNDLWKWIVGIASGVGLLALLAGALVSLRGWRHRDGGTRSWPAAHVQRWWDRNAERWRQRPRRPGGDAG